MKKLKGLLLSIMGFNPLLSNDLGLNIIDLEN